MAELTPSLIDADPAKLPPLAASPMAMCGRPPRCKEKMEDQQLGQVRSCVRPRKMRCAWPRAMMNSADRVPITSPHNVCRGHFGSSQSRL